MKVSVRDDGALETSALVGSSVRYVSNKIAALMLSYEFFDTLQHTVEVSYDSSTTLNVTTPQRLKQMFTL